MNDIKEFGPQSSLYELLSHLMDKIISGELMTFESLKQYASVLPKGQRAAAIFKRAFDLQRRLYWGFFKDVSPEAYPKLWAQVVVPDRDYPFAGDLKRYNSIQDVYLCMIDIHGYTKYCHDNRHNMSMLDLLDKMIQVDVPTIAKESGVISKRAHGDEILLLGSSAQDVLESVLRVIEYFSKRRRIADGPAGRPGTGFRLPEFFLSAGITGGQTYTSLVITRDGDISGDLVNSAARLQARANSISPLNNKVLLTSTVFQKLKGPADPARGFACFRTVDFFKMGTILFKGISLSVYDTVFLEREAYRLSYRGVMEELYDALDKGAWKSRIFELSVKLAVCLVENLPAEAKDKVDRHCILGSVKTATESFAVERYEKAIASFSDMVDELAKLPGVDSLAIEYLVGIRDNYAMIVDSFKASLDREIDEHLDTVYGQKDLETFHILRKHRAMYDEMRESAALKARGRKAVWYRESDKAAPELGVRIQSKK